MLKITRFKTDDATLRLQLDGRIVGEWVETLATELAREEATGVAIELDLSRVDFASESAVTVLHEARVRGVRVATCSPLVAALLERPG